MTDARQKFCFNFGDILYCEGGTLEIQKVLGYGGSSVLYEVLSPKTQLRLALKECYPADGSYSRGENGLIVGCNQEYSAKLQRYIAMMQREAQLGQNMRSNTLRVAPGFIEINPVQVKYNGQVYSTDNNPSCFLLLENLLGTSKSLSQILTEIKKENGFDSLPDINTTLSLIEKILRALESVHKQGYLHGDISLNNVWFENGSANQKYGEALFIDFGSSLELTNGESEELNKNQLFSTQGFRAPECENSSSSFRLTKAADLYSVGVLLLRLTTATYDFCLEEIKEGYEFSGLDESDANRIGCPNSVLPLLNAILSTSLYNDPKKRYSCVLRMLEDIKSLQKKLEDYKKPHFLPKNQYPISPASGSNFENRVELLNQIRSQFDKHKVVFISGISGMGKSELARKFAANSDEYNIVHVLTLDSDGKGDFDRLLTQCKEGGTWSPEPEIKKEERRALMRESGKDTLIIVDNFNCADNSLFQAILHETGSAKVLFTTQLNPTKLNILGNDSSVVEIPQNDFGFALSIFRRYAGLHNLTEEQTDTILEIVEVLGGHTMMSAIMGQAISVACETNNLNGVLLELKGSIRQALQVPIDVEITKDDVQMYGEPYNLLKNLFKHIVRREFTPAERQVIGAITLLPRSFCTKQDICRVIGDSSGWTSKHRSSLNALNLLIKDNLVMSYCDRIEIHPLLEQLFTDPDINGLNQTIAQLDIGYREHLSLQLMLENLDDETVYEQKTTWLWGINDWLLSYNEFLYDIWKDYKGQLPCWIDVIFHFMAHFYDLLSEQSFLSSSDKFYYHDKPRDTSLQELRKLVGHFSNNLFEPKDIVGLYLSMLSGSDRKGIYVTILTMDRQLVHHCIATNSLGRAERYYALGYSYEPDSSLEYSQATSYLALPLQDNIELPILSEIVGVPITIIEGNCYYRVKTQGVIPKTIEKLGGLAFARSPSLTSLGALPDLKVIGRSAFAACERLESVVLSASLKQVHDGAFMNCQSLKTVTLENSQSSVFHLAHNAFSYCDQLINFPPRIFCFDSWSIGLFEETSLEELNHLRETEEAQFQPDYLKLLNVYYKLGMIYSYFGLYKSGLKFYSKALNLIESRQLPSDSISLPLIYHNTGYILGIYGDFDNAINAYLTALDELSNTDVPSSVSLKKALIYIELERIYRYIGDTSTAKVCSKLCKDQLVNVEDPDGYLDLYQLSPIQFAIEEFEYSLSQMSEGRAIEKFSK